MGKNFDKASGGKNATSRLASSSAKKNISKKESDKKRRVAEYTKSVQRNAKIQAKKNEWEMRRQAKRKVAEFKKPAGFDKNKKDGDEWEDVDEHERDVFDRDGYYNVMETEAAISAGDQRILEQFKA